MQRGGVAALKAGDAAIAPMLQTYAARRALVVDGLNAIAGIECKAPEGAFYAFPNIAGLGMGDSQTFARWLLHTARVAVTPGSAFGPGGEGHIRLSFAASSQTLREAMARIRHALAARSDVASALASLSTP